MRKGPVYSQWVDFDNDDGSPYLRLPLELVHEWSDFRTVSWRDNGDGTYTLTPTNSI